MEGAEVYMSPQRFLAAAAPILAPVSAALAAAYLTVQPAYAGHRAGLGGPPVTRGLTLADVEGAWVHGLLLAIVLLALAPLLFRRARTIARPVQVGSAILLAVFVILAGFSIGFYFAPAAAFALMGLMDPTDPDPAAA